MTSRSARGDTDTNLNLPSYAALRTMSLAINPFVMSIIPQDEPYPSIRLSHPFFSTYMIYPVLRIRDVYPGSEFISSRIQGQKNLSISYPKNCFSALVNMRPGCSYRIRIPDPDLNCLPIPDPGIKKAPDPNTACITFFNANTCS